MVAVVVEEEAVASLPKEVADPVVPEVLEVEASDMTELHNLDLLDLEVVYVPDIHTELVHPELLEVTVELAVKLVKTVQLYPHQLRLVELLVQPYR